MAASKLLHAIDHNQLQAHHWHQRFVAGTSGAGYSGAIITGNGSGVPRTLDGIGGYAQIAFQPEYDCFVEIDAHSIWKTPNAAWMSVRTGIAVSPADADGKTFGSQQDGQSHSAMPQWRPIYHNDIFRLRAGQNYWFSLNAVAVSTPVKASIEWWTGGPFLRIEGHTFGHGHAYESPVDRQQGAEIVVPQQHLPPDQLYQVKTADRVNGLAGSDVAFSNTSTYSTLNDYNSRPMMITFTPKVNCFWRVKCRTTWLFGVMSGSGYSAARVRMALVPNDVDGQFTIGELDTTLHNGQPGHITNEFGGVFKLQAGTRYELHLQAYTPNGTQYSHARDDLLKLWGYTFGHGSF